MRFGRKELFEPILTAGLIQTMLNRLDGLETRLAPIESSYAVTQTTATGTVGKLEASIATVEALQQQLLDVAAFVTDGALSMLPVDTAMYANYPPFSARTMGIEDRLTAIGA